MTLLTVVIALSAIATVSAQRPPYAGQRPNGYHDRLNNTDVVPLTNRFGGNNAAASPAQQLPTAALGDAALVNQLNQRPVEQRPFWLVNYEAIEAQKNGGQRPTAAASTTITNNSNQLLPDLANRFAADDDATSSTRRPIAVSVEASQLGSHIDAANYEISQPEIVYPLGGLTVNTVTGGVQKPQPQVITLNGQQFLLTPLSKAGPVEQQRQSQPMYFD